MDEEQETQKRYGYEAKIKNPRRKDFQTDSSIVL